MRVTLHTRVRADRIAEYEQAHAAVLPELTEAIRAAGVTDWTIWRSGTDLFHLIELLEAVHDDSAGGAGAVLPVVWQL
jgi:L-rhamnose mutarotase